MLKSFKNVLRLFVRPCALLARSIGVVPPESVFRHLYQKGEFTVSLPENRGTLRLMSWGNRVENELYWRGWTGHEPTAMRWWARAVLDASCVLDIGANTGTFGFMAKALNPDATVHAFEPLARIAALAQENRDVSGLDVAVFQMAVADHEGELPIYDPGGVNAYSASLDPEFLAGDKEQYQVPVTTIDAHCASHDINPDLIKIDVEGVEGKVLLGAQEILQRKQAIILCEWLGKSSDHERARNLLVDLDYVCIDPDTGKVINFEDSRDYGDRNILLCPKSRADAFLEKGPLQ